MGKILNVIQFLCYSFIVGVAIPTFLHGSPIHPNYTFCILLVFLILFFVSIILRFLKFKSWFIFALISFFAFGVWRFFFVIDKSSPHHITWYLDKSWDEKTILRGTIVRDPDLREKYAFVDIKPHEIIPDPLNPWEIHELKGRTGYVRVKVYPTVGSYYYEMSYGDKVEIHSSILSPWTRTNPAGYDHRKYLRARNVYATAVVSNEEQFKYIGVGEVNFLVRIAFALRRRLLSVIRKTMPYPESAFLGGVTLGLRGGVPRKIREEFQATGIAHVLALSGLHVGFIAVLLYAIASILFLPPEVRFPVVSFGLLLFTLLTGATPATQRAALMYVLWMLFKDIFKLKMLASGRYSIPISAFIILLLNPLWLPDASFSLSFMAVASLVFLTPPIEKVLIYTKVRFIHRYITFPLFTLLTTMTIVSLIGGIAKRVFLVEKIFPVFGRLKPISEYFPMFSNIEKSQFLVLSVAIWICGIVFANLYQRVVRWEMSKTIIDDMRKNPVLRGMIFFVCSQLAIQLGMMWPLSGVYFYRFPIAGFYANFLAIPLIGIIVQLGWVVGLLHLLISSIGLDKIADSLALLLNAANYNLCQAFLGIGETWCEIVPYPYIKAYSWIELLLWYSMILLFIVHYPVYIYLKSLYFKHGLHKKRWIYGLISVFIILIVIISVFPKKQKLKLVFFDVRLGNCVLVLTPKGKSILIDTGPYEPFRDHVGTSIAPTLSLYGVNRLDALIFTSLTTQSWGGSRKIIEHFKPRVVFLPFDVSIMDEKTTFLEFLRKIKIPCDMKTLLREKHLSKLFELLYTFFKTVDKHKIIKLQTISSDMIIHAEDGFSIEALPLTTQDVDGELRFSVLLKIVHGRNSILIGSYTNIDTEKILINEYRDKLKSDVLLVPRNGSPKASSYEFIESVMPEYAIIQYGWSRFISISETKLLETIRRYREYSIKLLRTDKTGAVIYTSDGTSFKINTVLPFEMKEKEEVAIESEVF